MKEYLKPSGQVVMVADSSESVAKSLGWIPVNESESAKEPAKRVRKPKQES